MREQCFTATEYPYEWIEKLKNGRTSVTHEGAGRPSTATTDDNTERVCDMVLLDRRLNIDEVANCLQIIKNCYYKFSIFIEIKVVSLARIIIDSATYNKIKHQRRNICIFG
jgi:hypothetical protein